MSPLTEHVVLAVLLESVEGVHVKLVGRSRHHVVVGLRAVGRVEAGGRQSRSGRAVAVRVERHHLLLEHDGRLLVLRARRGSRSEHGLRDVLRLLLVDWRAALRVQNVRGNGLRKVVHVLRSHVRVVVELLLLLRSVVIHGRLHGSLGHILVFHWGWTISVSLEGPEAVVASSRRLPGGFGRCRV